MERDELMGLVKKHTKKDPKTNTDKLEKESLRQELMAYFRSEKGQKTIKKAPRVTLEITPDIIHDPVPGQPVEVIVDMILQEWS